MKVFKKLSPILLIFLFVFTSCKKEGDENQDIINNNGFVSFSTSNNLLENARIRGVDIESVSKALVTIKEEDGSGTSYNLSELNLYNMNGSYFTQKIALNHGDYQLTEFFLIDGDGNTVYATPMEGSNQAQNVNNPLPIFFSIENNISSDVTVEVIETANMDPEDFGLTWFPIIEIETFSFLISVSELGSNTLLSANLEVYNDIYTFYQLLDTITNNVVRVKDGYNEYTLKVQKSGYQTYIQTFTNEELKQYQNTPLVVELTAGGGIPTEGLVAFYPFNGNANDESGNNYHGTVIGGASLTSDRNGNENSCYNFDGYNDYILIGDVLNMGTSDFTISAWANAESIIGGTGQKIINKGLSIYGEPENAGYGIRIWNKNNSKQAVFMGGYSNNASISGITSNNWMHIVCIKESNSLKIVINNINISTSTTNTIIDHTNNLPLTIGALDRDNGMIDEYFDGKIDDIRIYNRALNDQEIEALYNE